MCSPIGMHRTIYVDDEKKEYNIEERGLSQKGSVALVSQAKHRSVTTL